MSAGEICPHVTQGSGRTQWMIDQLCDAVKDGQPKSRVFGHNENYATVDLKKRVIKALVLRGMAIGKVTKYHVEVEESVIWFYSIQARDRLLYGAESYGDFIDHYADGER